jgi:hypothetical protein
MAAAQYREEMQLLLRCNTLPVGRGDWTAQAAGL